MIGVVRKDRCGAEELFGEHCSHEQVRPGRRAERKQHIGGVALPFVMPVRCADQESCLPRPGVPPALQFPGELNGGQPFATLIQYDADAVRRHRRDVAPLFRELRHLRRPRDAPQITLDQIGLRRAANLPAGDNVEKHSLAREGRRAERPDHEGLEAVVDRTGSLRDRTGPVRPAARKDGHGDPVPVGHGDEAHVIREAG